jgi:hypothetical protein
MRKYSGKCNKWDGQMDIEKPPKRKFLFLAPEIAEDQVQPKGKNTNQYNCKPPGGKIHFSKYLNCCGPVKQSGLFALTFYFIIL